jgi:hypothetical protein
LTPQWTPESPKQGEIDTSRLPPDPAEIVTVCADLPEPIKVAIKALVQTHIEKGKQMGAMSTKELIRFMQKEIYDEKRDLFCSLGDGGRYATNEFAYAFTREAKLASTSQCADTPRPLWSNSR